MKRMIALALSLTLGFAYTGGLVGCSQKTETKKTEKVSTPSGTVEHTTTDTEKKTGDEKTP